MEKEFAGLPILADDIRFSTGPFHFIQGPQLFRIGFQPRQDFGPIQALMAVLVPFESGSQRPEEDVAVFQR
jgi:hypothetical protein